MLRKKMGNHFMIIWLKMYLDNLRKTQNVNYNWIKRINKKGICKVYLLKPSNGRYNV